MASARIAYLDNLRAFCMLFGILVQTNRLDEFAFWSLSLVVSEHFRMATFFAVSGFFASLLLARYGNRHFLRNRAVALLIPLAFGLAMLNPLAELLQAWLQAPAVPVALPWVARLPEILHLWFLFSLAAYAAMAPLADRALRTAAPILERLAERLSAAWLAPAVACAVVGAVVAMRVGDEILAELIGTKNNLLRATLMYWPYFLLGMAGYHARGFWGRLHRLDLPTAAAAAAIMTLAAAQPFGDGAVGTLLDVAGRAMATMAAMFALLWAFRRWVDVETPLSRGISDSVYTVYLTQLVFIYFWGVALTEAGISGTALFLATVALTWASGTALYFGAVRRSRLLTLLLRGRGHVTQRVAIMPAG